MDRYSYDCRIPGADYDATKRCIWTDAVTTAFQRELIIIYYYYLFFAGSAKDSISIAETLTLTVCK